MSKRFVVKNLAESHEIQRSYDKQNYFEVVIKCRTYIEGWLIEYIYAILHPTSATSSKENRKLVETQFSSMYIQTDWLLKQNYITENDYANINRIRRFCEDVIAKGDVFRVAPLDTLDKYIDATIHYCYKLKVLTRDTIEKATGQKISL